jgi:hypothetical protein
MPEGGRVVTDDEIEQGVRQAYADAAGKRREGRGHPPMVRPGLMRDLVAAGRGATVADIMARSPIPLKWPPEEGWRVLEALYQPGDLLFVGETETPGLIGQSIRPCREWVSHLQGLGRVPYSKAMPNPVSGNSAPTKDGASLTLRGDGCVAAFNFAVVEFDGITIEDQLAFWMAVPHLPVAALILSGKKSVHGWLRVDCADHSEWVAKVEQELFPGFLVPLGADGACKNPSRLSRMPGHRRAETGQLQQCIYLSAEGKAVSENE